jgi:hypothetical protein
MFRPQHTAASLEGALDQRFGVTEQAQSPVNTADGVHQLRLDLRLRAQFGLDPLRAFVQNLAGGDRASPRFARR